jgi:heptosyltransferase-2
MRVCIANPALLGDVLFSSRLCAAFNAANTATEIVFVAKPPADQLAQRFKGVVEVIPFKKRGVDRGVGGARRLARRLADLSLDAFISTHRGWRMALVARLLSKASGGQCATVGYAGLFGLAYEHQVPFDPRATYFAREAGLLSPLGVKSAGARMSVKAPTAARREGVVLAPGASMFSKRWPVEKFQALAQRLVEKQIPVRLTGGPAEVDLCAAIEKAAPRVENACGESLDEATGAIAKAAVVVANDSGLAHLARATRTPTLILFGPTAREVHDVTGERTVLLNQEVACAPCSPHGERRCPRGHHRCMEMLSVDRVLTHVADLLRDG